MNYPDDLHAESFATGMVVGANKGYQRGLEEGEAAGYTNGYQAGKSDGEAAGEATGYDKGYEAGLAAGGGGSLGPAEDGATELYIDIEADALKTVALRISQQAPNTVMIDWGDGITETKDSLYLVTHEYAQSGEYVIRLLPDENYLLSIGETGKTLFNDSTIASYSSTNYGTVLKKVVIGERIGSITEGAFRNCFRLREVYMSNGIKRIPGSCFYNCYALEKVRLSDSIVSINSGNEFRECHGLSEITFSHSLTSVGKSTFQGCTSLKKISFSSLKRIGESALSYCSSLQRVDLPETLTTIGKNILSYSSVCGEIHIRATTPPTLTANLSVGYSNYKIYIPAGTLEAYSTAEYWSSLVDRFIEE